MSAAGVLEDAYAALRARYRDFADHEARGVSPLACAGIGLAVRP